MFKGIALPRIGIAAKISLVGLVILGFVFLIVAVASWRIAGDQARGRIEGEIDIALRGFQDDLNLETQNLNTVGNWLAAQPRLAEMIQAHDSAGLADYLRPWARTQLADSIFVCDANGTVLAHVNSNASSSLPDQLPACPDMAQVRAGEPGSTLEQDSLGNLQERLILPISSSQQSSPLGLLSLSLFLDEDFVRHTTRPGSAQIAIIYNHQFSVTTLIDPQGKPLAGLTIPPEVFQAEREGRPSGLVTLDAGQGQYLFKFNPLHSPSQAIVGMYGIGRPSDEVEAPRVMLLLVIAVAFVIAASSLIVLKYALTRALGSAIRLLDSGVQSLTKGDLTARIVLSNNDALEDLGRQLDNLRVKLLQSAAEATLEKHRQEAIVRCMGIATVITDRNHHIISVNAATEALLQQKREELIDRPWQEVFTAAVQPTPSISSFWDLGLAEGQDRLTPVIHGNFRLRTQPQVVLDVVSTPVEDGLEPEGYVHIIRDISAQEKLLKSKDEFILNVAHELRGPIASLRSFIELLREDYATMNKRDAKLLLQALQRAVGKFQRLVENLIDIGRIQAGQFQVRPVPSELDQLLEEARDQVELVLKANDQHLEIQIHDPTAIVLADGPRVIQVLVNLLTNASKYSPEDQPILVSTCEEGNFIKIQVIDHGQGIAPEDQARIFERFYRVKREDDEGMGIGLGLALSKAIIEAHGGQIGVDSQLGQGATFWFTLHMFR